MSSPELNRLIEALRQPALRDGLGAELQRCGSAEEAAAVLRRAGYDISARELEEAAAELSDQALDQVGGAGLFSGWVREGVSVWDVRRGG
ncbi:Nif11-like leader peptide family natural product precursor [Pseudoroseomonas cervicalis]|uniref:Nif11-like leader peptide family natural product precursor n=1 Tax=Teichococcus cervicalis TaxID=204525 RepID=UPI0027D8C6FA|nr:Nif11-like leader peptide family natural product precursor [Pseudoroseomonas cervicalis]